MTSWSQTLYDYTFTDADLAGTAYVTGIPLLAQKAAIHAAQLLNGTSSTSLALGTGTKTLTTQASKSWGVGSPIRLTRTTNPTTHYMDGIVTAYNASTGAMTVEVGVVVGSGTFSAWTLNVGGARVTATLPLSVLEGGTGAISASAALTNLGGSAVGQSVFTAADAAAARTALGGTATGVAFFTAANQAAAQTAIGATTVGTNVLTAASAASARSAIGSGATGDALFTAANASSARTTLGGTSTGVALFTAVDAAAGRTALGLGGAAVLNLTDILPPAFIFPYAGGSVPSGFLICDGAAVSRTTYSALYSALGGASSPWGQGDGSTTFNVPDLRGRVLIGRDNMGGTAANRVTNAISGFDATLLGAAGGSEAKTIAVNNLPAHDHFVVSNGSGNGSAPTASNAFARISNQASGNNDYTAQGTATAATLGLSSQTGGNTALPILQPSVTTNWIIKT